MSFKNEKEIQSITEANLSEIFGLDFVKSEMSIAGLRIDTLAFDNDAESFVIIEYKPDKNFSVVDQGFAYLATILERKEACVLEYNSTKDKRLKPAEIDWTQCRVIFISPEFTEYQTKAIGFRGLAIELWQVSRFANNTISYERLRPIGASEPIAALGIANKEIQRVSKEIKVWTEQDHTDGKPDEVVRTYQKLKEKILSLGEGIQIRPRQECIGFNAQSNFAGTFLQKAQLKLFLNLPKGKLDDPKKVARDVSNLGHWCNGDYEITIKPNDDLDYVMKLVKQSYDKHI